jgi:hypothetical protein
MPSRWHVPTWQGCCQCWHSCSRRYPPCRLMVVAVAAFGRRWLLHWQRSNKVNEDNHNNMATTQQPTRQPKRQPTWRGNKIEWRERNYVFFHCPGMSQPLDSAMPGRPPKVPFWGQDRYVLCFYVKKCACGHGLRRGGTSRHSLWLCRNWY